jgi:septum formation protein
MNIVLASASPRRQELLKRLTKNFEIIVSNFDENSIKYDGNVCDYVCTLAQKKAEDILSQVQEHSLIIGCDTIVFYEGEILGKPTDEQQAFSMLKMLSNNTHYVYSAIVLIDSRSNEIKKACVCTEVKFMNLTDEIINEYISSREPFDKAGAYGIQGKGAVFVESIKGCYYNVVGLSINRLYLMFKEMGVNL